MTSTKEGKVISSVLSWPTRLTLALIPQWSQDCLEACCVWSLLDQLNISPKAQWILPTRTSLSSSAALAPATSCPLGGLFHSALVCHPAAGLRLRQHVGVYSLADTRSSGSTFLFKFDTIFRTSSSSKTPTWLTQSETFSTITFNSLFTLSLFRIEFPSGPLCDGTNEPPPVRLRVHRSAFTALVVLTSVRAASWYPGVTGLRQ